MFAFVDTDGSFDVQPGDIADIIKMSFDVDENMKMQIINNRMPRANFKFPERHCVDKSKKTGMRWLYCQASRFKRHQFIHCLLSERRWCFLSSMYLFSNSTYTRFPSRIPYFKTIHELEKKFMTIFPLMKLFNIT